MGRQENIDVFENTKQLGGKHAKLKEAIQKSNAEQKFYPERKTAVWKALAENVKDSTVIIVAQRISTILHAEQILVLDEGKIVGKGTHEELLKNCEVYQQIAKSQLSEKELGQQESEVADHE